VIGHSLNTDRHGAGDKIDRRNTMGFGEGEKWVGHEILRVSDGKLTWQRPEQFELSAL
jgi:hypothetical protein